MCVLPLENLSYFSIFLRVKVCTFFVHETIRVRVCMCVCIIYASVMSNSNNLTLIIPIWIETDSPNSTYRRTAAYYITQICFVTCNSLVLSHFSSSHLFYFLSFSLLRLIFNSDRKIKWMSHTWTKVRHVCVYMYLYLYIYYICLNYTWKFSYL